MPENEVKMLSKECPKCGHSNESDSSFCRNCGTNLAAYVVPGKTKGQVEFTGASTPKQQQDDFLCFGEASDVEGVAVVGGVFIIVGIFIGVVIIFPGFIGNFFGGFGESMGRLGSDFGNAMGDWGSTFGESMGYFFEQIFTDNLWWDALQLLIPVIFIVVGVIVILRSRRT
jgi:hypothetical protein